MKKIEEDDAEAALEQIKKILADRSDFCECERKCDKCGKPKRQSEPIYIPQPYPIYPYWPRLLWNPEPWISPVWSGTTTLAISNTGGTSGVEN